MAYNVDLDLFIKAASQGLRDGQSAGSMFSNFVGGFTQGVDAQQKYETEEQQQTIRANEIEQLPVTNRIQEAQADRADAELAGYRNDPEQYTENQAAVQQAAADKDAYQQKILAKEQQFMDVMQKSDGVTRGKVILSGEYDDVFAYNKDLRETVVKSTYRNWAPEDREIEKQLATSNRSRSFYEEAAKDFATNAEKNRLAFNSDPTIAEISRKAKASVAEILEHGEFVEVLKPPPVVVTETYKDEKGVEKTRNVIKEDTNALPDSWAKKQRFVYKGEEIDVNVDDTNTRKNFLAYKSTYNFKNSLLPGQGGYTDLAAEADASDKMKAEQLAKEKAAREMDQEEAERSFRGAVTGSNITPQYQTAAKKVESTREQNVKFDQEQRQSLAPTPAPTAAVTWNKDPSGTAMTFSEGAAPLTPTPKPSQIDALKASRANIASKYLEKYKTPVTPALPTAEPTAAPVQGTPLAAPEAVPTTVPVSQTVGGFKAPEQITTLVSPGISAKPNPAAVQRVASNPNAYGYSALVKAVMAVESAGNESAVSPTGVKGLMQVTKGTADAIGISDRTDPGQSVFAGATLLENDLANPVYKDNPMLAVTSYNAGPAVVQKAIQMAGGNTDWEIVKNYLEPATLSLGSYWKSIGVNPQQKAKEVRAYAEKVAVYFSPFITYPSDMEMARKLREQKVLQFDV